MLLDKCVGISSAGGHLFELKASLEAGVHSEIIYLTHRNGHTIQSLSGETHYFILDPHTSAFKFVLNSFQALVLFLKIRPRFVISTGAGIAIPFMVIAKIFGSKIIYIESGARVLTPSKTGKLAYIFADKFFV